MDFTGHARTKTGIPINYRYPSVTDIPADVRATVAPKTDYPPLRPGQRGPGARQGRDGKTFWCLSCESAVAKSTTTWCSMCTTDRNNASQSAGRAAANGEPTHLTLPMYMVDGIIEDADAVAATITGAILEFDRAHMTGGQIDELMIATKKLQNRISSTLRREVKNARNPPVTAAQVQAQRAAAAKRAPARPRTPPTS